VHVHVCVCVCVCVCDLLSLSGTSKNASSDVVFWVLYGSVTVLWAQPTQSVGRHGRQRGVITHLHTLAADTNGMNCEAIFEQTCHICQHCTHRCEGLLVAPVLLRYRQ
jgi:hypothetical protein